MKNEFSHLDDRGRARMVDVGGKKKTARAARAEALVVMSPSLLERLTSQTLPKGRSVRSGADRGYPRSEKDLGPDTTVSSVTALAD